MHIRNEMNLLFWMPSCFLFLSVLNSGLIISRRYDSVPMETKCDSKRLPSAATIRCESLHSQSRVQSARSVGDNSLLESVGYFTPRPPTREFSANVLGNSRNRGKLKHVRSPPNISSSTSKANLEAMRAFHLTEPPSPPEVFEEDVPKECSAPKSKKKLSNFKGENSCNPVPCPTTATQNKDTVAALQQGLDKLSEEMRQLMIVQASRSNVADNKLLHHMNNLKLDAKTRESLEKTKQNRKEQKLAAARRSLFMSNSCSARITTNTAGQGMHKLVRDRVLKLKQEKLEEYLSSEQPQDFFGSPSYLSVLRSEQQNGGTCMLQKHVQYKQTSLSELLKPPIVTRDIKEVQQNKIERDLRRMEEISAKVQYRSSLATSSGANAHHCVKMWSTWIILLQVSRVFADAIACKWNPFDDDKRKHALFHPPHGLHRILALTKAANVIAKHYRVRKASRRKHHAATTLQEWAIKAVKNMKLNVAVHQYLIKVKKIQKSVRTYQKMKASRQLLWCQQWVREESKVMRMVELAKDGEICAAVQLAKDKESGKHKEVSTIGQPVGPHLTSKQKKDKAILRKRVEEFRALERDRLVTESFFVRFQECEVLRKTAPEVIFKKLRPIYEEMSSKRLEEYKKLIRTIATRRAYLEKYCQDTGMTMSEAAAEVMNKDPPLPTVSVIPKYLRRQVILENMLEVQAENRYPKFDDTLLEESRKEYADAKLNSSSASFTRVKSFARRGTVRNLNASSANFSPSASVSISRHKSFAKK